MFANVCKTMHKQHKHDFTHVFTGDHYIKGNTNVIVNEWIIYTQYADITTSMMDSLS